MTTRNCKSCIHRIAGECRHPQAVNIWGRIVGMKNSLTDRGWPRWPKADGWCGFFAPDADWLRAQECQPERDRRAA